MNTQNKYKNGGCPYGQPPKILLQVVISSFQRLQPEQLLTILGDLVSSE